MHTLITCLALTLSAVTAQEPEATMSAVRVTAFGGPAVLKLEQVARPTPRAGEALVRVHAAGVNPVDWKIREGMLKGMTPEPPFIPGYDVAGEIESIGKEHIAQFNVGDKVFAYLSLPRGGGYAEYVCIPVKDMARLPQKTPTTQDGSTIFTQGAATPLAALTAWQALFDQATLKPGQTVLIHGAAGGVGHFAVQFARVKGAKVFATASPGNHDFLKGLGAEVLIDYNTQKFEDVVKEKTGGAGVDVVLDTIGGDTQARSIGIIKKGGTLVSIVQPPDPAKCKEAGISGKVFLVQPSGTELTEIASLIDEGKVTAHVSQILPLSEAAKAQEISKSGKTRGKIVLTVK